MKIQKKTPIIECIQWNGNNLEEIINFLSKNLNDFEVKINNKHVLRITRQNDKICNYLLDVAENFYIISTSYGNFYVLTEDEIKNEYIIVEE